MTLGVASRPARGAETIDPPRVGSLREFDRFTFEGATNFSGENLWLGLNSTYSFPAQSHPLAPRDAFLTAIGRQLHLGYIHCGFPDARITASFDDQADRVIVQIQEGIRYRCGQVEVIGARNIPTQPIVAALTVTNAVTDSSPQSFRFLDNAPANRIGDVETNGSMIWVKGQPAHFDGLGLQYMSGKVTNTLAQHGFFLSRFTLNIVTNAAARTATLQVKILDEGPPATLDRIEVVGNRKNSREALLNYLGLKPGMTFTSELVAAVNDRLYHSARFLTNSVVVGPPDASGRVKLAVAVVENDQGPPLTGKFDPMQQVMLKTRDWLAKLDDSGEEAVLSLSGGSNGASSVQCILAPHQGLLVLENEPVSATNRLRHALIMSSRQFALYAPGRQQKCVSHFSTRQFKSSITIETHAPDANGNCGDFTVGAGLNSDDDLPNPPPYALSLSLAPAAFVRLAHGTNSANWFTRDQLVLSNADTVLKLDARTGRFIDLTSIGQEPHPFRMNLHFEPDAFESALARIEQQGAGFTNVYRTNAPLGSAIAFFGGELVQLPWVDAWLRTRLPAATCEQIPTLLQHLGTQDFLAPFEDLMNLRKNTNDPAGVFEIPERPQPVSGDPLVTAMMAAARYVLEGGDLIFQPRSWPWTVSRDLALLFRAQETYALPDMRAISDSSETGPIGCLVAAQFLKTKDPQALKVTVARGLERLSTEGFRTDCRVLLDEHYFAGQFAARLAATLGVLDEPELDAFVQPMTAAQARFIRNCAQRVRAAQTGQPLFETLAPALDEYWESELKQNVANQLRQLANE